MSLLNGIIEHFEKERAELLELRQFRTSIIAELQAIAPLLKDQPEWSDAKGVVTIAKEVVQRLKASNASE